jgi:hypothetical protein
MNGPTADQVRVEVVSLRKDNTRLRATLAAVLAAMNRSALVSARAELLVARALDRAG